LHITLHVTQAVRFVTDCTYPAAIPQCCIAALAAFSKNDNPIRETVGTMVRGVTYLTITPTIPVVMNNG
jgi:hypothetical protein